MRKTIFGKVWLRGEGESDIAALVRMCWVSVENVKINVEITGHQYKV